MPTTRQILLGRNPPVPLPPKEVKVAKMGVNKRPVEVGFGKQASKLVLSLEVSLSRSHLPTREWGLENPTPASPPYSALGRQVLEARPTPASGPAQPHLQAPKLGWAQWVAGGRFPSPGGAGARTYTESGICCSERTTSPRAA